MPDKFEEDIRVELLRVLKNLAAPKEQQIAYLQQLGTFPLFDELALEFEDIFFVVKSKKYNFLLKVMNLLENLSKNLEDMSKKEWLADTMTEKCWDRVRNVAREAFMKVKEREQPKRKV